MAKTTLRFFIIIAISLFLATTAKNVFAQDSLRTGVKFGFLPLLSFNTDEGIYLGSEIQRYDYSNQQPFRSYTYARASYKTNGAFGLTLVRDEVKTFGSEIRTKFDVSSSQNFADYYLGDTENIGFDKARFDTSDYFRFKSFRINIGGVSRFPVKLSDGISRVDIKAGIRMVYETPWGNESDRFINEAKITGSNGAFLSFLELGLYIEHRDSEFRSQSGYSIDIGTKLSPPGISTQQTMENYLYLKGFVPLYDKLPITLASRISFQNTIGDTPYWFKPNLGGSGSIRGFIYRRFISDNAISYSIELRSWLLKFPWKNLEFGLTAFADGGRVFSNENWNMIFKKHNLALGLGGVMSIFTPDFILKYEMGFSEDGAGVYLGTGYSF
jgi:hypothetical protein